MCITLNVVGLAEPSLFCDEMTANLAFPRMQMSGSSPHPSVCICLLFWHVSIALDVKSRSTKHMQVKEDHTEIYSQTISQQVLIGTSNAMPHMGSSHRGPAAEASWKPCITPDSTLCFSRSHPWPMSLAPLAPLAPGPSTKPSIVEASALPNFILTWLVPACMHEETETLP